MGDSVTEMEKSKRKRSELSSISEISEQDTSVNTDSHKVKRKKKQKPAKERKRKEAEEEIEKEYERNRALSSKQDGYEKSVKEEIAEINRKMTNMLTKDDMNLRQIITEVFQQMKEELLKSVEKKIEVLECKLFEKENENDRLKKEIKHLKSEIEDQKEVVEKLNKEVVDQKGENVKLKKRTDRYYEKTKEKLNDAEQYSRRNNLRLTGVPEKGDETAEQTTKMLISLLNTNIKDLNLQMGDIDIAHRLGKRRQDKPRTIIVKFVSRITRDIIYSLRQELKGTNIYINEDLTYINQLVLSCLRKKMPDEVDRAWSKQGRLFYKNKKGEVKDVEYQEFDAWIELAWPTDPKRIR